MKKNKLTYEELEKKIALLNRTATTLRKKRDRYKIIIEGMEQSYYEVDFSGIFTFVNNAMCKLIGYSKDELIGNKYNKFIDKNNSNNLYRIFRKVFITERPNPGFVLEIKKKDGLNRHVGSSVSLVKDKEGKCYGFRGMARDITNRKNLEIQNERAHKLESIGQLAAGISHEINTPTQYVSDNNRFLQKSFKSILQVLSKYMELFNATKAGFVSKELSAEIETAIHNARIDYLKEEIPKAIRESLDGLGRISKIVRAMNNFSHPGTIEKTETNINEAIQNTITVTRNEWKYVADIVTDLDPTLPKVQCITGELNQVILNLTLNAAHAVSDSHSYGSEKKGIIKISSRKVEKWVEIRFSDTGTGIPKEIRSRVFDPFFTTKEVGKGTGQGLNISYLVIVNNHGGTIDFKTELGKGTTFIVRLPIEDALRRKK